MDLNWAKQNYIKPYEARKRLTLSLYFILNVYQRKKEDARIFIIGKKDTT